jgi:hypothetical protein
VPVSLRFPAHPGADEHDWQELVVRHLGLRQWERLALDQELDVLGSIATTALRTHGLLWPPASHIYVPALEVARGGSLITSLDHGTLLEGWRWARVHAVLHRRTPPEPRDLLRVGLAFAPARLRRWVHARAVASHLPWVRPSALDMVVRSFVRDGSSQEPRRWDRRIARVAGRRYLRLWAHSVDVLGAARDVEVHHPLLNRVVLSSLAAGGGADGWSELYGDLLPDVVLARRPTRAEMGPVLWGRRARAFAERWDGSGLDLELIDPDRLRAIWTGEHPWLGASTLAQAAWLAAEAGEAGDRTGR